MRVATLRRLYMDNHPRWRRVPLGFKPSTKMATLATPPLPTVPYTPTTLSPGANLSPSLRRYVLTRLRTCSELERTPGGFYQTLTGNGAYAFCARCRALCPSPESSRPAYRAQRNGRCATAQRRPPPSASLTPLSPPPQIDRGRSRGRYLDNIHTHRLFLDSCATLPDPACRCTGLVVCRLWMWPPLASGTVL